MLSIFEHFSLWVTVISDDLYWRLFGNHGGWLENLSYVANLVMGLSAVFATVYAVRQFSHANKMSNMTFVMDMIDRIAEVRTGIPAAVTNGSGDVFHLKLFNLLEAYCGFYREKAVSGQARKALWALLKEEVPTVMQLDPYKQMLANSASHPTMFENVKWFLDRVSK